VPNVRDIISPRRTAGAATSCEFGPAYINGIIRNLEMVSDNRTDLERFHQVLEVTNKSKSEMMTEELNLLRICTRTDQDECRAGNSEEQE